MKFWGTSVPAQQMTHNCLPVSAKQGAGEGIEALRDTVLQCSPDQRSKRGTRFLYIRRFKHPRGLCKQCYEMIRRVGKSRVIKHAILFRDLDCHPSDKPD